MTRASESSKRTTDSVTLFCEERWRYQSGRKGSLTGRYVSLRADLLPIVWLENKSAHAEGQRHQCQLREFLSRPLAVNYGWQ